MVWYPGKNVASAPAYTIVSGPSSPFIPLDQIKEHLKLDASDTSQDDYLTLLGNASYNYAESFTRRTFLTTEFKTYRDYFTPCFLLRRSNLQSVDSIQYYKDGNLTTVDASIYYRTVSNDYSSVYLKEHKSWPQDHDSRKQAIEITFTAGYGDDWTDIPEDLRVAMLNHVAKVYESRGDCDTSSGGCGGICTANLPPTSKLIYGMYKIHNIIGADCCG